MIGASSASPPSSAISRPSLKPSSARRRFRIRADHFLGAAPAEAPGAVRRQGLDNQGEAVGFDDGVIADGGAAGRLQRRHAPRSAATARVVGRVAQRLKPGGLGRPRRGFRSPGRPGPEAGGASTGSSSIFGRSPRPRRFRPASARRMASASPARSLASRVSTLPRSMTTSRSGRRCRDWAWRRRLAVPRARAARQRIEGLEPLAEEGVARILALRHGGDDQAGRQGGGMSFREWTAQSIRPSSRASSISLVKRPLPPTSRRRRSWMRSPEVVMRSGGRRPAPRRARRRGRR